MESSHHLIIPDYELKGQVKILNHCRYSKALFIYSPPPTQKDEKNSATDTFKSLACRNTNRCKGKEICDGHYGQKVLRNHSE